MLKLYLTRHGETLWNTQWRMQGWLDSPLTPNGINDANLLGERLEEVEFDCIYSSSSKRAYDTALIIKGDRDIPLIKKDNLREMKLGTLEGKIKNEMTKEEKIEIEHFWNYPDKFNITQGETFYQLQNRIVREIKKICLKHKDGNILIVTHATALKTFLCYIENKEINRLWDPPFINGASLSIVNYEKNNIELYADTSHIIKERNLKTV